MGRRFKLCCSKDDILQDWGLESEDDGGLMYSEAHSTKVCSSFSHNLSLK